MTHVSRVIESRQMQPRRARADLGDPIHSPNIVTSNCMRNLLMHHDHKAPGMLEKVTYASDMYSQQSLYSRHIYDDADRFYKAVALAV